VLCLGAGRWQDANKSTFGTVREILEAHTPEARNTKLDDSGPSSSSDDVLLCHPNYRPREGESKLVYKPPIMDISTAAYDDVELILERIEDELIEGKGMNAVLCVGDQQTFSRMWHLKLDDPAKYFWIVPCSGDFHYQFHVASGVNRIVAYAPLLQWFVNAADMSKTFKDKMDDTCHMKYIDHFYQLVIKSILTYLTDVYGHEYMAGEPSVLLEENETHIGDKVLVVVGGNMKWNKKTTRTQQNKSGSMPIKPKQ
jgi:hypothetical protein